MGLKLIKYETSKGTDPKLTINKPVPFRLIAPQPTS